MKSKPKHLAKRILVFLLTLSILWSESSFVSLAQTINGETTESFQGIFYEEPSEGSEAEITEITEGETDPGKPEGDPADLEGDSEDPEDGLGDPKEDLEEAGNPEEEPAEEPVEAPEDAEEPEDSEESEDSEELSEEVENEEVKYDTGTVDTGKLAFRIGDAGSDWNGGDVPGDSVIKIYNNADENPGYLKQEDVEDIIWYVRWLTGPDAPIDDYFEAHRGDEFDLKHRFNPVDIELKVEITLNGGEKHEMTLNRVEASPTVSAPEGVKLDGTAMPGFELSLTGTHKDLDGNYWFLRADDNKGTNAVFVICNETSYTIDNAGNGKYIYAKYAVWDEEGNGTFYETEPVYVGYHMGNNVTDADKKTNAGLLQKAIDKAAEDASRTGNQKQVNIPAGVQIMADEPIILYDGVTLNVDDNSAHTITGSIQVKKYEGNAKPVGEARIENLYLSLDSEGVTAIDASSDVFVVLNNCRFDINKNATLLKVSKDNYARTEINGSIAYFSKGGALLSMEEDPSMPSVFKLGNTDLQVNVEGSNNVVMNSSTGVKWNVNGLRPKDMDSLVKLTPDNVINNVFWFEGYDWVSNSKELIVDSAYNNYISYTLADGSSFTAEDAKIIVEPNNNPAGKYEVTDIPKPEGWDNFRPYAVTGTYTAGTGDYKNLLPKNYLTYIVVDVNQRSGFPYGALVGKEINLPNYEDFVVMQYHKDKSVETVASIVGKEVESSNYNSGFAGIEYLGSGKYKLLVNTKVKGEDVAEPIVLAVYANAKASGVKLSVYEEEIYYDNADMMRQEFPSDGKILTDGDKTVYFRLNEGVVNNALEQKDDAFEIMSGGYTVPDGQDISKVVSENGATMTLTIPEGTYGTLTVKAHYKGSATEKATDFTYKLQLTTIDNIEGVTVDYVNSGKKYYGTATFEVLSGEAKPFLSVKSRNGENSRYNFKVISSSLSGKTVTVQYMLDLRSENGEAWDSFAQNPPCLLVETAAGTWEIPFEVSGKDKLSVEKDGVRYLFDLENNNAVFTGALIIDGNSYYSPNSPTKLEIPETVSGHNVTAMAEGCLNEIYENGIRRPAPEVVIIPKYVTDIRGDLVTNKSYSDLRQIVVDDGNTVYFTNGTRSAFDSENRDDADYCALYKKNGSDTELIEIASNYEGELSWRDDAVWNEDTTDNLDFSNITGFRCNETNTKYEAWDGILVSVVWDDDIRLIKAPEKMGTAAVIPEGIMSIAPKALEKTTVDTLVLPSTLKLDAWTDGRTKAKNIYVYNEWDVCPFKDLDESVTGVTFYGFTNDKGESALKQFVTSPDFKARKYKFVAMKKTGAKVDYTVNTLRKAELYKDKEYYVVQVGDELSENLDFDIVSKVTNGYSGKTDVIAEIVDDEDFGQITGEFEKCVREDGSKYYKVVKFGVAKVEIKNQLDGNVIKTVYFAVFPGYFAYVNNNYNDRIALGTTDNIIMEAFYWSQEAEDNVPAPLPEAALKEYEALGVLRSETPEIRNIGKDGEDKDAWNIVRVPKEANDNSNKVTYAVTPLLGRDSNGNIKGDIGLDIDFVLLGHALAPYNNPIPDGEYSLLLGDEKDDNNNDYDINDLIMENKGDNVEIPVMKRYWEEDPSKSPVSYDISFGNEENREKFPQVACEVISGSKFVDAEIINKNDNAYLKLTAKANGKAQVRVYTPYAYNSEMILTVSVGTGLVEGFELKLFKKLDDKEQIRGEQTLHSSIYSWDNYEFVFDIDEGWNQIINVSDINIPSGKLKWTVSDTGLAVLVKGDTKDKNKVTGIQLKGEGTVLVTAAVNDTNAAAIRMLFTVKNVKPRLHNDNASLDIYKVDSTAEYTFAVPDGVVIEDAEIESVVLNKKGAADNKDAFIFTYDAENKKVLVSIKDKNSIMTAGTYNLKFNVTAGAESDEFKYDYTVTLKLAGTTPKVTVTSADTIDLSVPSKRESALTTKVGDVVDGEGTKIELNITDATTKNFSEYFTLVRNENFEDAAVYIITFVNANGRTPAEIVKLFNGKKIKLTITSDEYRNCPATADVTFKITATTPAIKVDGGGKVTVNTTNFAAYEGRDDNYGVYTAETSYTLTDGFKLLSDANDEEGNDAVIKMEIAKNQTAYQDMITFRQEGDRIIAMVNPKVPKGTYTFTWTPEVRAFSDGIDDNIFTNIPLKSQKISVVVTTSTAKAAFSSTKLVVDRNYKYSGPSACLQFDENQIKSLYGSSYWFGWIDEDKTNESITLVTVPKGVSLEDPKIWVGYGAYNNSINAGVYDTDGVKAGEYKYSITPYVMVGFNVDGNDVFYPMALAPISFSVQVTDKLPTATLSQTTVTMDNNMSNRVFLKWNVKGNYNYIVGPWVYGDENGNVSDEVNNSPEFKYSYENGNAPENGPIVYLEGEDIRVETDENTLKGTYKISITPQVVLDEDWQEPYDKNKVSLAPVTLTVKVNDARPAVKLEKSKLTVNSTYPGLKDTDENGWFVNVPAEAVTEINTSNGYAIGNIEVKAADNKAKAIQENENTKITFSQGKYDWGGLHRFAAIPTADTPNGTYNFLVYAWQHDDGKPDNKGQALEPVKLQVIVKNAKPTLKLSASSILLPAGREGRADITLQGQTDLVSGIKKKTEYLVKENGKWILKEVENNEQVPDNAYARLDTADDGRITVTSLGKSDTVSNAKVTYIQETCLIGNEDSEGTKSYNASYSYNLTFNLTSAAPKAVLSANKITVNKNYSEWEQEGMEVKLTLNNGEKVNCDITDTNPAKPVDKQNVIDFMRVDDDEYGITYRAYFARPDKVVKGDYTFKLTPKVIGADGKEKALSPVTLKVTVTDTMPTVKASTTKVTINKLDRRGNTWQQIHLKPSLSYADVRYDVAVTKGPKGVDPMDINFCQDGWWDIHNEGDLNLGSCDPEIPDGAYTVTVTPYTRVDGKRKDLNKINIAVTVTSPKVTAAVQSPKMTIDVATADTVYMKNTIMLTGTNADCVNKLYWDWELTKKPKGAEERELWLEDRWNEGDETDGKEIYICWGNKNQNEGSRDVNVTPGVYEFTITPTGVEIHDRDNVSVSTPAPVKVTVTVKNSMPTVKYGKTTSKMNMVFLNKDNTFITLSDTSWNLKYVDAVMTSWPKGAGVEDKSGLWIDFEDDRLVVRGSEKVLEGTYTFTLEPHVNKNGIEMPLKEQKYTVTVKNEIPTVKASSAKLTCNMNYAGAYGFEKNPEDNFNKKLQMKLTLNKYYGPSRFEDVKITFTGKAAQQAEADKIDWRFYCEDGIVAVRLREGCVVSTGNYTFEITPSIRSDLTGVKMTLKPVKITVTVENKVLKATAKVSGKIDLLDRENGITYTVALSDKDADAISWIGIVPPENGKGELWLFNSEFIPAGDTAKCIIRVNEWVEDISTKVNYTLRLEVNTMYGKKYYIPITIKPTQSKLTVKSDVTSVTLFKQGSYDTAAVVEINASAPSGEKEIIVDWNYELNINELTTGNEDFRAEVIGYNEDSKSVKVKIQFASEQAKGKYKAGSKVILPIYVNVYNQATDSYNTVKINITVNIKN